MEAAARRPPLNAPKDTSKVGHASDGSCVRNVSYRLFMEQHSLDAKVRSATHNIVREVGVASQADLARRWGISRQRVHVLSRTAPGFPEPVAVVNGAPVWVIAECDEWWPRRAIHRHLAAAATIAEAHGASW